LSDLHEFLPVTFHHEFGVKRRNQWQDGVHVLYSIVQSHKCTVVLDVFVDLGGRVALFGLHVLNKGHERFSVNLIPKSGLPVLKLRLNESDEIPHVLERNKLISAVLELLVR
jgi:hypothetical protein